MSKIQASRAVNAKRRRDCTAMSLEVVTLIFAIAMILHAYRLVDDPAKQLRSIFELFGWSPSTRASSLAVRPTAGLLRWSNSAEGR